MMNVDLNQLAAARALGVDMPRSEPRIRVRVVSRVSGHCELGIRFDSDGDGVNDVEIYESDLPKLRALVETEGLGQARARLASYVDACERRRRGEVVSDDELPKRPPSLEMCFRELHRRDVRPFISVDVLDAKASDEPAKAKAKA